MVSMKERLPLSKLYRKVTLLLECSPFLMYSSRVKLLYDIGLKHTRNVVNLYFQGRNELYGEHE